MASSSIKVEIVCDTRQLRRQFLLAELLMARSPIKRLRLRYRLWSISRERL